MEHFVYPSDVLYILGDLFEVWIGDDDNVSETATATIKLLKSFTDNGGQGFIMHGNRDFLLGEHFCSQTGFTLLAEPYQLQLGNKDCVLLHGDSLCTDDVEYQKFKVMVRNPDWQVMFLDKPIIERRAIADGMRDKSKESAQMKAEDIMDVADSAVMELLKTTGVDAIIHGHTHRQNRHQIRLGDRIKERIVLGDWGDTCSVLVCEDQQLAIQNYTLAQLTNAGPTSTT